MITTQIIDSIYKQFRKRPKDTSCINTEILSEDFLACHEIRLIDDTIIIGSVEHQSPFREIKLGHVHAIVDFDGHTAIVLHSSIIFLTKESPKVDVHIKMKKPPLLTRIKRKLRPINRPLNQKRTSHDVLFYGSLQLSANASNMKLTIIQH